MTLPTDAQERKDTPIFSGVLRYFPRAIAYVAMVSKAGNDQHHPGTPLHWDKSKSTDEGDALVRHQMEAGTVDADGILHSGKVAWRGLAQLERELEAAEAQEDYDNRDGGKHAPLRNAGSAELTKLLDERVHTVKRSALDYFAESSGVVRDGLGRRISMRPGAPVRYSNEVEGP